MMSEGELSDRSVEGGSQSSLNKGSVKNVCSQSEKSKGHRPSNKEDKAILIPTKPSQEKKARTQNAEKHPARRAAGNDKDAKNNRNTKTADKQKKSDDKEKDHSEKKETTNEKNQSPSRDVKLISKLVRRKLENYMNRERREFGFNVHGSYTTTRKMHEYDLSYKLIENGPMDQRFLRKQAKDEKNNKNESKSATCILPQLCTNSRRVVLSFEAAYIAERANEIFDSSPMEKLTLVHRYRPYSRHVKVADNGHMQNYSRHVRNALQVDDYITYYKQQDLGTGSPSNPRMQALKKAEKNNKESKKETKEQPKKKAIREKTRSRRNSTSTQTSYSTNFSSASSTSSRQSRRSEKRSLSDHQSSEKIDSHQDHHSTSGADDEYSTSTMSSSPPSSSSSTPRSGYPETPNRRQPYSVPSPRRDDQSSAAASVKSSAISEVRPPSSKSSKSARSVQSVESKNSSEVSSIKSCPEEPEPINNDAQRSEAPSTIDEEEHQESKRPESRMSEAGKSSRPVSAASRQELYSTVEHSVEGSMSSRAGSRRGSAKSLRSRSSVPSLKPSLKRSETTSPFLERKPVEGNDEENNNATEEEEQEVIRMRNEENMITDSEQEGVGPESTDKQEKLDDEDTDAKQQRDSASDEDDAGPESTEKPNNETKTSNADDDNRDRTLQQKEDHPSKHGDEEETQEQENEKESESLGSKPPKNYISVKPKEKDDFFD